MTPEERQRLRTLCEQATAGPWHSTDGVVWREVESQTPTCCNRPNWDGDPRNEPECCGRPDYLPEQEKVADTSAADAEFIAALNPTTARTLVDEIERLTRERDESRQRVHDAFRRRKEDGSCDCPYCRNENEEIFEHAANLELDRHSAIGRAEAAEARVAALEAENANMRQHLDSLYEISKDSQP